MKMKTQILFIHGGSTFKNRADFLVNLKEWEITLDKNVKWFKEYLDKKLGRDFEIIRLRMPLADDARYEEWKVYFEKHLPFIRQNVILIGFSLGGVFLAKYLSENRFPKKILATYLVGASYDNSHSNEPLLGGFKLKSDISLLEKDTNLTMLFSADDECVPVYHAEQYKKKLSKAKIIIYKGKNGHFNVPIFPEIIKMIKSNK